MRHFIDTLAEQPKRTRQLYSPQAIGDEKYALFGRTLKILKGLVAGDIVEAPEAIELPDRDFCRGLFRYRICNGVHRYLASFAAGYSLIPLRRWFA